jgi:hypothetical protein
VGAGSGSRTPGSAGSRTDRHLPRRPNHGVPSPAGPVEIRGARYLGGHPRRPKAADVTFLRLSAAGLEFRTGMTPIAVPPHSLREVAVMRDRAAARAALSPPPPLDLEGAADGEGPESFLVVATDGCTVAFSVRGTTPHDLFESLVPVLQRLAVVGIPPPGGSPWVDGPEETLGARIAEGLPVNGKPSVEGLGSSPDAFNDPHTARPPAPEDRSWWSEPRADPERAADLDDGAVPEWAETPRCPSGHRVPDGARFCPACGAAVAGLRCRRGHTVALGASFCSTCGVPLGPDRPDVPAGVEVLRRRAREAGALLVSMRLAQQVEMNRLLWEDRGHDVDGAPPWIDGDHGVVANPRFLPLRETFHEQHVVVKRADMALAEAEVEAGLVPPSEAPLLLALRRIELEFASLMLLEVTELVALPRNDTEGERLVLEHLGDLMSECAERRAETLIRLAVARGEPHAIRSAELEAALLGTQRSLRRLEEHRSADRRTLTQQRIDVAQLRVDQLEARRRAAEIREDWDDVNDASEALCLARESLESVRATGNRTDGAGSRRGDADAPEHITAVAAAFPGLFRPGVGGERSNKRRLAAAKRLLGEFRSSFVTLFPAMSDVPEDVAKELEACWNEYDQVAGRVAALPIRPGGRSASRQRVQWDKADGVVLEVAARRLDVVDAEREAADRGGDPRRAEALEVLGAALGEYRRRLSKAIDAAQPIDHR